MLTRNHRQEALSRAYVQAVAAHAGVICSRPDPDYGIDLSLRAVEVRDGRRADVSVQVDLQLRSTTRANVTDTDVTYDLDVGTYNHLREPSLLCPTVLVVFVMPADEAGWLSQSPAELSLRHCAYWLSLENAPPVAARSSVRVSIPQANVFSVEAVRALLEQAKRGSP